MVLIHLKGCLQLMNYYPYISTSTEEPGFLALTENLPFEVRVFDSVHQILLDTLE
jgi:hypothetical protein